MPSTSVHIKDNTQLKLLNKSSTFIKYNYNPLKMSKKDNLLTSANATPRAQINIVPHMIRDFMKWRPFIHKGEGLIQMDICGNLFIPLSQTIFHVVKFLVIFYCFLGPELLRPF